MPNNFMTFVLGGVAEQLERAPAYISVPAGHGSKRAVMYARKMQMLYL